MTHRRFDEIVDKMMSRWSESPTASNPNVNIRNICERMLCTALYEVTRDLDKWLELDAEDSAPDVILAINSPEP